ncbi:MAG: HD domain-containing protein [Elusimicrobia bacterium]|nr:HD domain-containing protein [Elusimicrobiota bacterium]
MTLAAAAGPGGLGPIEEERRSRLESRAAQGAEAGAMFEACLAAHAEGEARARILEAYRFAQRIEYTHAGLTPAAYLAHPARVACLAMRLVKPLDAETVVVGLVHNVLEVSRLTEDDVAGALGRPVAEMLVALTVDRRRTSEDDTKAYYERLSRAPWAARLVKILDKLDNLFLLCLNPDDMVRSSYLREIETYIVPMAGRDLPELSHYLRLLIENCRTTGHRS